jgi:carboxyl-terminal processing protease
MSRWNLSWLVGITAVTLVGLSLTYSAPTRDSRIQKKHENLSLLVEVIEEVKDKYVKELSDDDMRQFVEDMVELALERKDPYSGYLNPKEYQDFKKQSRGKFGGIGIRISVDRGGQIYVDSPMVGTPAYEAGILAGDLIVKVDGKSTENLSLKKVVELIQGEPGEKVTLSVIHEGSKKAVDIDIVRAEINVESILGDKRLEQNLKEWDFWIDPVTRIGYIRLVAFTEATAADLTAIVAKLQKENMRGLVVDLRNNPGGLLRAAVEVSSMFLPEGKTIVTTRGRNQKEEVYKSHNVPGVVPDGYPVAILINRWSASASEIVAAALQDHLRAVIIGERSYGKGSVQNIIPVESNLSALKLTTASYWRPSEKNIHRFPNAKPTDEWGVKPSDGFEIKLSDEERLAYYKDRRRRDIVLKPGQKLPEEKAEDDKKGDDDKSVVPPDRQRQEDKNEGTKKADKKKEPFRDRVLDKALEYIRKELNKDDKQGVRAPAAVPAPRRQEATPAEVLDSAFLHPRSSQTTELEVASLSPTSSLTSAS